VPIPPVQAWDAIKTAKGERRMDSEIGPFEYSFLTIQMAWNYSSVVAV
jgi:hypothetical protein